MQKPRILILTSGLLSDRFFLHNNFLPELAGQAEVIIWATAWKEPNFQAISIPGVRIESFPKVGDMPMKYQYLRRLNDYAWDERLKPANRLSQWKHVRSKQLTPILKAIKIASKLVNAVGLNPSLEKVSERLYIKSHRSPEAAQRLKELKPDLVVSSNIFRKDEPGITAEVRALGIPAAAIFISFDNISTKNRFMFDYSAYYVWSEHMKHELRQYYPYTAKKPVYIMGTPQYDVFRIEKYQSTREDFCKELGFDPNIPIVLFALGSPNLFKEIYALAEFVRLCNERGMYNFQLLVRPHPSFSQDAELKKTASAFPNVYVQDAGADKNPGYTVDEYRLREWVNTFRHADVVINMASTVTLDACYNGKPVVNLDFDPEPGSPQQQMIKDINRTWEHFKVVAQSGATWNVENYEQLMEAVAAYLADSTLHAERRQWITEYICTSNDGHNAERLAHGLLQALNDLKPKK